MKTIVYGGSFNPPTIAHEFIINYFKQKNYNLLVVPVGDQYNKAGLISVENRSDMLELIHDKVLRKPKYVCSSGTYELLEKLMEEGYKDLWYVIGADNLIELDTWKNYKDLISKYNFIVFKREGYDAEKIINEKYPEYKNHFEIIDLDIKVSATEFRKTKNKNLVPKLVYDYIKKNNLYGI